VCEHHNFTLEKMRSYAAEQGKGCAMCCCFMKSSAYDGLDHSVMPLGIVRDIYIESWFSHDDPPMIHYEYPGWMDQYICPHMKITDTKIQGRIRDQIPNPTTRYGKADFALGRCDHVHCDTTIAVACDGLGMWFRIVRDFGDLRDGADPQWCAQLEVCNLLPCRSPS
jgi:hypothetical protein